MSKSLNSSGKTSENTATIELIFLCCFHITSSVPVNIRCANDDDSWASCQRGNDKKSTSRRGLHTIQTLLRMQDYHVSMLNWKLSQIFKENTRERLLKFQSRTECFGLWWIKDRFYLFLYSFRRQERVTQGSKMNNHMNIKHIFFNYTIEKSLFIIQSSAVFFMRQFSR